MEEAFWQKGKEAEDRIEVKGGLDGIVELFESVDKDAKVTCGVLGEKQICDNLSGNTEVLIELIPYFSPKIFCSSS